MSMMHEPQWNRSEHATGKGRHGCLESLCSEYLPSNYLLSLLLRG